MDKKKKKQKQPSHVGLAHNINSQTAYKNYVISGGTSTFEQWKRENK